VVKYLRSRTAPRNGTRCRDDQVGLTFVTRKSSYVDFEILRLSGYCCNWNMDFSQ
jgi:hypothetical protein